MSVALEEFRDMNLFDLTGQNALVTGSSQGIGLAIATALGRAGAKVTLNGRDELKLRAAVKELQQLGIQASMSAFDVTDVAEVRKAIDAIENDAGPIDILVNSAGIQRRTPLEDFTPEAWSEVMRTNVDSVFFVGQAVARYMIKRGRGKIINVASVMSEAARSTGAPYTASKGAVKNLTKGMCADWAKYGLQINAIGPGYFDTPMTEALVANSEFSSWLCKRTPAGRWGKVEELAGAAVFLASRASSFVNGQTIYVDGGVLAVL
jgi:gluconate 5-dehydrogenase